MLSNVLTRLRAASALSGVLFLAACATLPSSGPTAHDINRGARPSENVLGFTIIDIDQPTIASVEARVSAVDAAQSTLVSLSQTARTDVVGPGDILSIGIYEVGASLFGSGRDLGGSYDASAKGEPFPTIVVDRAGDIRLPYVGRLHVAGLAPAEIQAMIEKGLRGKSQDPQALVAVRQNVSSTVFVSGDVRKPGRFDLSLQRERLLDAIAMAGGAANSAEDTIVRFNRGIHTLEERLGRIRAGAPDDLVLIPGDRIELIRRPRSFIVMGAAGKVAQVSFETGDLSLAEAIARAGGPSDAIADPAAIYLFRYDPNGPASPSDKPIIYKLDMMRPASYFLSQRFAMRDKDVVFVANAAANRPAKLVNILNAVFSPLVTARAVAGN